MCIAEIPSENMSAVKMMQDDAQFQAELAGAGSKLVVVDFTASWCGPCKRIAPFYDELSAKYPNAVFLKVNIDITSLQRCSLLFLLCKFHSFPIHFLIRLMLINAKRQPQVRE